MWFARVGRSLARGWTAAATTMSTLPDKTVKNVVILVAMEAEAAPMIEGLGLKEDGNKFPPAAPCKCFSGQYRGGELHLVTNGKCQRFGVDNVGTVAAGLSAWLALETLKPDLLINAGTAGGFKKEGAGIGDVYLCSEMKNHDRRIPIPGFKEWGIGDHSGVPTPAMQRELGFKSGSVTTGNSLDATDMDFQMMKDNGATVKDMEAAAVAWACEQHGAPFFCVKVVTDIVDGDKPTEEEFLANLKAAAESLQDAVPKTLDFAIERKLADF